MNEYRIVLIDRNGIRQDDHVLSATAQEAADIIRQEWKGCYIAKISLTVTDWM